MTAKATEKIAPIDPERFHRALGVYQAAVAAQKSPHAAGESSSQGQKEAAEEAAGIRGIRAVKKEFPDAKEFQSLSLRLQRFAEVIGDKKLAKWGMVAYTKNGGFEIHDAVINALAKAPFRKSGVLDKVAFHTLVKAELERLKAEEKE
jgi:hypothetical protein